MRILRSPPHRRWAWHRTSNWFDVLSRPCMCSKLFLHWRSRAFHRWWNDAVRTCSRRSLFLVFSGHRPQWLNGASCYLSWALVSLELLTSSCICFSFQFRALLSQCPWTRPLVWLSSRCHLISWCLTAPSLCYRRRWIVTQRLRTLCPMHFLGTPLKVRRKRHTGKLSDCSY